MAMKRKRKNEHAKFRMARALADYLEEQGWRALGGVQIRGPVGLRHNYEVVITMSGGKIESKPEVKPKPLTRAGKPARPMGKGSGKRKGGKW